MAVVEPGLIRSEKCALALFAESSNSVNKAIIEAVDLMRVRQLGKTPLVANVQFFATKRAFHLR